MKATRGALTSLSEGETEDKFGLCSFTFYTRKKNGILLAFIPIYMDHWRTIWGSKIFDRSGKIESSSVEGFYARESCPVGSMYMVGEPR